MNFFIIFFTGLTTGGLACLAVQGGLLASVIANQKDQEHSELLSDKELKKAQKKQKYLKNLQGNKFSLKSFDYLDWMPVVMFLVAKLIAHTILGFLLGILGSAITLSLGVKLGFQTFTALFMFATAMNLLKVHPIFRYVAFQPPRFLQRYIKNTSKSRALFAPVLLGIMTIFIPCGVTQAMEVLAINTGNPVQGALTMFFFVLGTMPLFAFIGIATAKLSEGWYEKFTKVAAYALVAMAVFSINGVLLVTNSPLTLNKLVSPITYFFSDERFSNVAVTPTTNGIQTVSIEVLDNGYNPNYLKVKKGIPVELTLTSNGVYSCALSFILKEFGVRASLKATDSQTLTFTPNKAGKFIYTCSMGMYSGTLEVI